MQLAALVLLPTPALSSPEQASSLNDPKLCLAIVLKKPQGTTCNACVRLTNISETP